MAVVDPKVKVASAATAGGNASNSAFNLFIIVSKFRVAVALLSDFDHNSHGTPDIRQPEFTMKSEWLA